MEPTNPNASQYRRKNRTVRLEDEIWDDLKIKSDQLSMTRSEVMFLLIVGFLDGSIKLPNLCLTYGSGQTPERDMNDPFRATPAEGMIPPA